MLIVYKRMRPESEWLFPWWTTRWERLRYEGDLMVVLLPNVRYAFGGMVVRDET